MTDSATTYLVTMRLCQAQLNVLIRSLSRATVWERLFWHVKIIGCRRRARKDHKGTPLAKVFQIPDEWALLKLRALASRRPCPCPS